jgi:hypothetical protein
VQLADLSSTQKQIVGLSGAQQAVDETAARRTLRRQIASLERQLQEIAFEGFPHIAADAGVANNAPPRLLDLGELECIRDQLAAKLKAANDALQRELERQQQNRALLERMKRAPESYKFTRVARRDIGEPGCGEWEVRPRLGVIGMLMGWWQVKVSSGCPLA